MFVFSAAVILMRHRQRQILLQIALSSPQIKGKIQEGRKGSREEGRKGGPQPIYLYFICMKNIVDRLVSQIIDSY